MFSPILWILDGALQITKGFHFDEIRPVFSLLLVLLLSYLRNHCQFKVITMYECGFSLIILYLHVDLQSILR